MTLKVNDRIYWFEISETPDTIMVFRFDGYVTANPTSDFPSCQPTSGTERKVYVGRMALTYREATDKLRIWLEKCKRRSAQKYNKALSTYC